MIGLSNLSEELKNEWLSKIEKNEKMQAEAGQAAQQQAMSSMKLEESIKKEEIKIKKQELAIKEKELKLDYLKAGMDYGLKSSERIVKQIQTGVSNGIPDQN